MKMNELIREKVKKNYWNEENNCSITTIKVLSEIFKVKINEEVINSCVGLPGSGRTGAQCGLVSSTVMFIGIIGKKYYLGNDTIREICSNFTKKFKNEFGNLNCEVLRPEGFKKENPPHICEKLTNESIILGHEIIKKEIYDKYSI